MLFTDPKLNICFQKLSAAEQLHAAKEREEQLVSDACHISRSPGLICVQERLRSVIATGKSSKLSCGL